MWGIRHPASIIGVTVLRRRIMSVVYVLGLGASFGEALQALEMPAGTLTPRLVTPPLANGFFRRDLLDALQYDPAADYGDVIEYMRFISQLAAPFGQEGWQDLNLEHVFTSIELEREFSGNESDEGGRLVIIRNKLLRYIG